MHTAASHGVAYRFIVLNAALALAVACAGDGDASDLLVGTVGAADTGMAAADLASPRSPAGAQFANPAGIAGFDTVLDLGIGVAWGTGRVRANVPAGYEKENSVVVAIPEFAYVKRGNGSWSFAAGIQGTVGTRYAFGKKPSVDIDHDLFAEFTIAAAPLTLAYRANERLWLGIQLMPLFGYFRSHFDIPPYTPGFDPVFQPRYTLRGPGIGAMGGVSWHVNDRVSLALSARPPGKVWMDGSSLTPSGERQDTDLHLALPAEVSAGAAFRPTDDWTLAYTVRWVDSSSFGECDVRFEETSEFDFPFIPDAIDEWRHAVGAEWRPTSLVALRLGVSHAGHIVGNRGVTPLSFDGDDTRVSAGAGLKRDRWSFDLGAVYKVPDSRDVGPAEPAMLAGHYRTGAAVLVFFGVTRELD